MVGAMSSILMSAHSLLAPVITGRMLLRAGTLSIATITTTTTTGSGWVSVRE
jgi:hypothetical protein